MQAGELSGTLLLYRRPQKSGHETLIALATIPLPFKKEYVRYRHFVPYDINDLIDEMSVKARTHDFDVYVVNKKSLNREIWDGFLYPLDEKEVDLVSEECESSGLTVSFGPVPDF